MVCVQKTLALQYYKESIYSHMEISTQPCNIQNVIGKSSDHLLLRLKLL